MAEIKSHEFERFSKRANELYRIFVVYGPDRGLVSERAALLVNKSGIAKDDPFATLKLDAADLLNDPGRLLDEVNALGLFGGEKLVWLRNTSNEKAVVDALRHLSEAPPPVNYLIIEAGDLKKGTGLRKIAEPSRNIATIPCYADDTRALNALIDLVLAEDGLKISPSARRRLLELIGGDRVASRNEISKLALYCRGKETIEEDDVVAIIGDASSASVDDAIDAILIGDLAALRHALQKVTASKTPLFLVMQSCLRQFQMMELMRAEMDEKGAQAAQITQTFGRRIHFKRKPIIEKALRNWTLDALSREAERIHSAILEGRKRQTLEVDIAFQTLMVIALHSKRAYRRTAG